MSAGAVASPCVGVCRLDADKVCVGCRRSLEEIAAWSRLDDAQKRGILLSAARRARAAAEDVAEEEEKGG